jgi:hypothetical protein
MAQPNGASQWNFPAWSIGGDEPHRQISPPEIGLRRIGVCQCRYAMRSSRFETKFRTGSSALHWPITVPRQASGLAEPSSYPRHISQTMVRTSLVMPPERARHAGRDGRGANIRVYWFALPVDGDAGLTLVGGRAGLRWRAGTNRLTGRLRGCASGSKPGRTPGIAAGCAKSQTIPARVSAHLCKNSAAPSCSGSCHPGALLRQPRSNPPRWLRPQRTRVVAFATAVVVTISLATAAPSTAVRMSASWLEQVRAAIDKASTLAHSS